MKFRTEITPSNPGFFLQHTQKIFSIGSCFATAMSERLQFHKFSVLSNPFGNLFNVVSIENALIRIYSNDLYSEEELLHFNGMYHSWDHHGSFSSPKKEEILLNINETITQANSFLQDTDVVILTLGSSFVYFLNEWEIPVANCHKVPQNRFSKKLTSLEDTVSVLQSCMNVLRDISRKDLKFICTVSPVRHIKDGIIENQRSKSILVEALHRIQEEFSEVYYFPSYEMVVDDLRDYRFYKEDMAHPSAEAEQYIWEKFSETFFTATTQQLNKEIESIQQQLLHKPLFPDSEAHLQSQKKLEEKIRQLQEQHPFLMF